MSSKPKQPLKFCQSDDVFVELVRRRAYEFYIERGREDGHDVEDWLRAEEEVLSENEKPVAAAA
jgi:hypothetical protein